MVDDNEFSLTGEVTRIRRFEKVAHLSIKQEANKRTSYFDVTSFDDTTGADEGAFIKVSGSVSSNNIDRNNEYNLPKYLQWQPQLIAREIEIITAAPAKPVDNHGTGTNVNNSVRNQKPNVEIDDSDLPF